MKRAFLFLLLLSPTVLQAAKNVENNGVERRTNFLQNSKTMFSDYIQVRDGAWLNTDGIVERHRRIREKLDAWVESWSLIDKKFANPVTLGQPRPSLLTLESSLYDSVLSQQESLHAIRLEATQLTRDTEVLIARLGASPVNGYDMQGFEESYAAQKNAVNRLIATMDELVRKMNRSLDAIHSSQEPLYIGLKSKLSLTMLNNGIATLNEAQSMVDNVFAAEKILAPILSELRASVITLYKADIKLQVFGLHEAHDRFGKACIQAKSEISRTPMSERYRGKGTEIVNRVCNTTEDYFNQIISGLGSAELMAQSIKDAGGREETVGRFCRDNQSPKFLEKNCQVYSWAKLITRDQILRMSESQLKDLEAVWDLIDLGPQADFK